MILGVLSLGLGILALIGLLTVAKELFCDRSLDANCMDADGITVEQDLGGCAGRPRCGMTQ